MSVLDDRDWCAPGKCISEDRLRSDVKQPVSDRDSAAYVCAYCGAPVCLACQRASVPDYGDFCDPCGTVMDANERGAR